MTKKEKPVIVGFCFSFPLVHESIKAAKLLKWTKGFQNEGGIGSDPAKLLRSAFKTKAGALTSSLILNSFS